MEGERWRRRWDGIWGPAFVSAGCVSGGGGGSGLTRANPELQETRTARRKRRGLVVRERVWVPPHETSSHVVCLEVAETFAVLGVDVGAMRMALGLSGNERQAQHVVGYKGGKRAWVGLAGSGWSGVVGYSRRAVDVWRSVEGWQA